MDTVSEIQIIPVKPKDGLIAFASFVINGKVYVGNVAVYTRPADHSIRLVYPQKTLPNGKSIHCVHPITRELGEAIEQAVFQRYKQVIPDELS
ncbi:MAG: hypothetical protein A2Z27_03535 [candidate division Zixibacteria bacterium RBG_16_50_21]|nr:MAG: hypothetical protein A2Z27_03535 [candidate division Zixibacteria bacterium RBG_16_50_21]